MRYISVFEENITGTEAKCHVSLLNVFVCHVRSAHHIILRRIKEFSISRAYVSTKSLKHSYDRRPDFMDNNIEFLFRTVKDPDFICENIIGKNGKMICKRGDFILFRHRYGDKYYGVPVEITKTITNNKYLEVVSFFPSNAKYMKKFPVIWERDNPEGLPTLWDREDGVNPPS